GESAAEAGRENLYIINGLQKTSPLKGDGRWYHGSLLAGPGIAVVSCATAALDATHAARASLAGAQAPDCTVVRRPRLAVELPAMGTAETSDERQAMGEGSLFWASRKPELALLRDGKRQGR